MMIEDSDVLGAGSELVVLYHDDHDDDVSILSLGDQSYVLDLANQRQFREERRREEAMEDALELFKLAVEEGAPKSVELFKTIMEQVLNELNEENRGKDRLQDEWLEAALQEEAERQKRDSLNVSHHTMTSYQSRGDMSAISGPPSIYNGTRSTIMMRHHSNKRMIELDEKIHDEEKNILQKKLQKAETMLQEIVNEKGMKAAMETKKYKAIQKKIKEYHATMRKVEKDDLRVSRHSQARSVMYDWGTTDDDDDTAFMNEDKDDAASSSSSSSEESEASERSSGPDAEDLEWAKQVVARLTLNADDEDGVEKDETSVEEIKTTEVEKAKPKRTPHKNISFNTTMATTRRMSGFDLRMKAKHSVHAPLVTKHQQLAATKEEEEDEPEESETALVSDGSTQSNMTPRNKVESPSAPVFSPGKRKSPSWKTTDVVNNIPMKHVVSDNGLPKPISNPPLSEAPKPVISPNADNTATVKGEISTPRILDEPKAPRSTSDATTTSRLPLSPAPKTLVSPAAAKSISTARHSDASNAHVSSEDSETASGSPLSERPRAMLSPTAAKTVSTTMMSDASKPQVSTNTKKSTASPRSSEKSKPDIASPSKKRTVVKNQSSSRLTVVPKPEFSPANEWTVVKPVASPLVSAKSKTKAFRTKKQAMVKPIAATGLSESSKPETTTGSSKEGPMADTISSPSSPALSEKPTPKGVDHQSETAEASSSKPVYGGKYSLEDFQKGRATDVDMDKWEQFLSTGEFKKHFGMSRAAFEDMPKWKQNSAKRNLRTW